MNYQKNIIKFRKKLKIKLSMLLKKKRKIPQCIIDVIEIYPDSDRENSDKENFNEEN